MGALWVPKEGGQTHLSDSEATGVAQRLSEASESQEGSHWLQLGLPLLPLPEPVVSPTSGDRDVLHAVFCVRSLKRCLDLPLSKSGY